MQQISVAINSFRIRFDCLPGDCPNATDFFGVNSATCPNGGGATGTCNGNADQFVNGYAGAGYVENIYAWQHLSMAKLIPWFFSGSAMTGGSSLHLFVGTNLPASSFNPGIGYNFYSVRTYLPSAWRKTIEVGAVGNPNYDVLSGAGLTASSKQPRYKVR